MSSRRQIRRELERLGWEARWEASDGAVVVGYGPYRLCVQFDPHTGLPTSLISQRVGEEGVFAQGWRGMEDLLTPEEAVRQLYKRRAGPRPD